MIFWTKFTQKERFRSKIEKINTTTEFCLLELVEQPSFRLNWKCWFFGPHLPKNGICGIKQKKSTLLRASMFVTYYTKLFGTDADIRNGILMSLLLLVAGYSDILFERFSKNVLCVSICSCSTTISTVYMKTLRKLEISLVYIMVWRNFLWLSLWDMRKIWPLENQ